jgi:hypothetical protein
MIFDIGPFRLYRVQDSETLDITLKCMDGWACGWEYGWADPLRGVNTAIIEFRIGKLTLLYLDLWNGGGEIWFIGFWAFPSWGKRRKK